MRHFPRPIGFNEKQPNSAPSRELIASSRGMFERDIPSRCRPLATHAEPVDLLSWEGLQRPVYRDDEHVAILDKELAARHNAFNRLGRVGQWRYRLRSVLLSFRLSSVSHIDMG